MEASQIKILHMVLKISATSQSQDKIVSLHHQCSIGRVT
jgi:hypothetical protein